MKIETVPFEKTGYFSNLICDYIVGEKQLKSYYNNFPSISGFKQQIEQKKKSFSNGTREILHNALLVQYRNVKASESTINNIQKLKHHNTFTVVTGHQLNLFSGPLYFLYKIISTINLTERLATEYPEFNFVPVYWMATEDHDFEEINYFNFKGEKIQWKIPSNGPVGRLSTDSLSTIFTVIEEKFGTTKREEKLKELFRKSYLQNKNLADATRYMVNELFGEYGLVIVDGDDVSLKRQFIPYLEQELFDFISFKKVSETINKFPDEYIIQVNPREINLFYMTDNLRERIVFEDGKYRTIVSNASWTKEEIKQELHEYPERFSPNVLLRPLYQEVILPNLCYIGGGGELGYWFELKQYFESVSIPLPILLLRNSALLITKKQRLKLEKLNLTVEDVFLKQEKLLSKKTKEISDIDIDFSSQKNFLKQQFKDLYHLAEQTDKSFFGAVKAQEVKQLKGLDKLEKRLLKAQKRKLSDKLERVSQLQNSLFPKGSLQERYANFTEFYIAYGDEFIDCLKNSLDVLRLEFHILTL